jgi:hypothetical protein
MGIPGRVGHRSEKGRIRSIPDNSDEACAANKLGEKKALCDRFVVA